MVRKYLISLFVLTLFSTWAQATTQVVATIDKNPVVVNESFVLEITANDDVDTSALDTSALLKDFIVGRTQVSSQTSMVNFKTSRTTRWLTVLVPRRTGELIIPSFTIDGVQSEPITLNVVDGDLGSTNPDIFITTELSNDDVYVQQQVSLKVFLHFAVELRRGTLTEPQQASVNIKQQGEDKESTAIINGRRFRVIERNYLLSPQKSGELAIEPPIFNGEVMNDNRRSLFSSFGQSKPVSVLADPITLNVRPIPDNYNGLWLPSDLVTLHEEWQSSDGNAPDNNEFIAGEPITRTITLTAANLAQEQLPELSFDVPKKIKLYPDQAELHTRVQNDTLISQHKQSFALVAAKPGSYELPEMRIPWWNTKTKRTQYAVLPARTITVIAGEGTSTSFTPPQHSTQTGDEPQVHAQQGIAGIPAMPQANNQTNYLQWVFLAGWILTALAWLISARSKHQIPQSDQTASSTTHTDIIEKPENEKKAYLALIAACKQHKPKEVEKRIIYWAQYRLNQPQLAQLKQISAAFNDTSLSNALAELDRFNYGKDENNWSSSQLLLAVQALRKQPKRAQEQTLSLDLNP